MRLITRLPVHECVTRLKYYGRLTPTDDVNISQRFCFRDGSPRMSTEVDGVDFRTYIMNQPEHGGDDYAGQYCICARTADPSMGGTKIEGRFVACSVVWLMFACVVLLTAFFVWGVLTEPFPDRWLRVSVAILVPFMWLGCGGLVVWQRWLITGFLKQILQAR
jgi:hypothetical protein